MKIPIIPKSDNAFTNAPCEDCTPMPIPINGLEKKLVNDEQMLTSLDNVEKDPSASIIPLYSSCPEAIAGIISENNDIRRLCIKDSVIKN